jgi:hypothetical protein
LIEPKSQKAIEEAVSFLHNSPSTRKSFATQARKKMQTHYEQKKFWNKMLHFYNSQLQNS